MKWYEFPSYTRHGNTINPTWVAAIIVLFALILIVPLVAGLW